ncbi:hypothetical protein [Streptomyces sparsogenes]|nr:hypothetical protein [Streptomyces sparsogenes]
MKTLFRRMMDRWKNHCRPKFTAARVSAATAVAGLAITVIEKQPWF